ncbi:MAG: response regulator [Planctomycetota bacterium]
MHKVLVVDDDKSLARGLQIRLVNQGFQVLTAHNALVAVGQALKQHPDVVILDISMPAADGFWVAETVHSLPLTRDMPIIFITASKKPELRDLARKLGGVAFFEKPFEMADLIACVRQTIAAKNTPRR